MGAIVGWAILSPYAKHKGWAPGEVDDWETGSRGWIVWVSLASLLADASVKLAWFLFKPIWKNFCASGSVRSRLREFWGKSIQRQPPRRSDIRYSAVPDGVHDDSDSFQASHAQNAGWSSRRHCVLQEGKNTSFIDSMISQRSALALVSSVIICVLAVHFIFGNIIPWFYTLLAIALSLPMAMVGIRCIAETDYNPESALGMPS